ncbi:MAG: alpha/beta fold hydrolase [Gammaproteobacteria bacterium]|nr:alpha/beta fold hydrolase [Gammaproteobacteria bacterium]NND59750.1 alpha/beta fold hydrolase [Gammaproteobacteria bacterium]
MKIHRNKLAGAVVAVLAIAGLLIGCETADNALFEAGRSAMRAFAGLEQGTVSVDGRDMAYLHRPGDGPTVVLIHGFASEKDVWLRFLGDIPRDYAVYAIDLPGHGDSFRDPAFHYDIPAIVATLEAAISQLTDGPVHMVGTSLGGMIATLYTVSQPDRVESLALYAPAGVYPPNPSEFQVALERGENPLIAHAESDFDELMEIVFHKPPPMIWPVGSAIRDYAVERADFHQKIWNDLWPEHPTLNDVLPQIDVPVMLVWGREDKVLDVSSSQVFSALVKDIEVDLIEAAGHAIVNERPRDMGRLYQQFLSDHSGETD